MFRTNLFDGESYHAIFARLTYKWFISRKWITYADIMADYMMLDSAEELVYNVSNCDNYGELKKAFRDVRNAIKLKVGNDCFDEQGNNRSKRFRYIGPDDDPLADMRNAKVVKDLKKYWQFCQDSAGFFPISWLEYYFKDCQDLLDIKSRKLKGEQILNTSADRMVHNIEYLPILYQAILDKQVLDINYQPFEEDVRQLIFHPHCLKEFNGRWYLFGHAEGRFPENGYNLALDRIVDKPRSYDKSKYMSAPLGFYADMFRDIIGVTHSINAEVKEIIIRANTLYMFKLVETKKLHRTQETILPYGTYDGEEYGEFSVSVEVNREFIGRILQMGAELEIVSPLEVREEFMQTVIKLAELYNKN